MSSSADEVSEARDAVVAGNSRTPPPRNRRGAPTSRPSATMVSDVAEADDTALAPRPRESSGARRPDRGSEATKTKPFEFADGPAPAAAPTGSVDEPEHVDEAPTAGSTREQGRRTKAVRRSERRFRQTVVKVDLWSVTKMALCFYVSAMAVAVVALTALWVVADSAGIIDNVEKFIGDLFSSKDFHFVSGQVLRGAVLVAVVLVALMVVFTIIAASFYNIFSELFGGVEVVIREDEHPPKG
jgi:hypothetical protein